MRNFRSSNLESTETMLTLRDFRDPKLTNKISGHVHHPDALIHVNETHGLVIGNH